MIQRHSIFLIIILILAVGCVPRASGSPKPDSAILTSTTFLADIARNVAGDQQSVASILPEGADPHNYEPTPQDIARIESARVIILNGAEYEHFLEPILENASAQVIIIEASAGINAREDARGVDPHMWLDPNLVITYTENIRAGFERYDEQHSSIYQVNAQRYIEQLKSLDAWIVEQVNQIPAERRLLITNHESLNYFAQRYGFTVTGAIIPNVSSAASSSAQQMAQLIDQIKATKAPAIFLDAGDNPVLAQQIAQETDVKIVNDLYLETLNQLVPTYIEMMKHNVKRIVEVLK